MYSSSLLRLRRLVHARLSWVAVLLVAPGALVGVAAGEQALQEAMTLQARSDQEAQRSQQRINALANEAAELLGEYRLTLQRLDQMRIYNEHLERLLQDQQREAASIRRQLDEFADVQQGIVPLMLRMIDDLAVAIGLDVPFLPDERSERIERLRETMDRADVSDSEKFRQIMEAYQIEAAFGRDMEAYRGVLADSGREVDFLRVGRILLAYQTPDRSETGFWNRHTARWEVLPERYRSPITQGIRIARAQSAPELLMLPVSSPERSQ